MSDFNSLVQYTVENISRPVKYIIYKLTEFIRVVDKFVFRQVPSGAASGYATIEQIEGNTVKFNQRMNLSTNTIKGIKLTNNGDGSYTLSGVSNGTGDCDFYILITDKLGVLNDRFYFSIDYERDVSNVYTWCTLNELKNKYGNYKVISRISDVGSFDIIVKNNSDFSTPLTIYITWVNITAIFGAGNEPSTVADFEAWMAQNIGSQSYFAYNVGELLSVKMSGMQTQDSSQQTLDTIALDVTTITGINTSTNVREVIFADGMKQADYAGTVKDTLDLLSDKATVRCGIVDLGDLNNWLLQPNYGQGQGRAFLDNYSGGSILSDRYTFKSNIGASVNNMEIGSSSPSSTIWVEDNSITATTPEDYSAAMSGRKIIYALTTPIEYTDLQDANGNPLNPRYKVEQGGTEQILPANTSTPTTVAPTLTTTYTKNVH